jgi:predicted transcriptional regulator
MSASAGAEMRELRPVEPISRFLKSCYDVATIKALEDAIAKVSKLPEDRQAYVAEVLEQIAEADRSDLFVVPDDHVPGILEGLKQAERGEFASDKEMAALWKKYGL